MSLTIGSTEFAVNIFDWIGTCYYVIRKGLTLSKFRKWTKIQFDLNCSRPGSWKNSECRIPMMIVWLYGYN